jgi:hypothetical protein
VAQERVRFREGQAKGSLAATVRYVTYLSGRRSTDAIYYQVVSAVPPSTIPSSYNGPSVKRFRCHRARALPLDMLLLCAALSATYHISFPGSLPIGLQGPGPIAAVRHEVLTTTLEIALISCAGLATWAMGWKVAAMEVKLGSEYAQHRTGNAAEEGPDTREAVFDKFGNRRLLLLAHPANPGRG